MNYELAIIGGGPAASGATVYAGRKQLQTIVIAEEIGGQSAVSETIYNWIGTPAIGGTALAQSLREHMEEYTKEKAGERGTVTLALGKRVTQVSKAGEYFAITLSDGTTYSAKAVLIATGSRHRKLDVPGASALDNKGIMYCATCDGPLFGGMPVAIIGGGNAAFEAALQLSQYASSVTLIHRSDSFRADPITVERVQHDPKITIVTNAELTAVTGEQFVDGLTYKQKGSDQEQHLALSGIFVEIGQIPNTELVGSLVERTDYGTVVVDPRTQRTTLEGVWAAGDCTDGKYHQNNIAVGDAIKALEDIYIWLKTQS